MVMITRGLDGRLDGICGSCILRSVSKGSVTCFLLQLILLGLILDLRADHQTRRARRASSAHADVRTLGMSAVSPLLRGSVSAVEAHWLRHNILFGEMHQTYTLHFAKPLQYHTEYLRPQMLSVVSLVS